MAKYPSPSAKVADIIEEFGPNFEYVVTPRQMIAIDNITSDQIDAFGATDYQYMIQILTQLHAKRDIEPLLTLLPGLSGDNWSMNDFLQYYRAIGPITLPALITLLSDTTQDEYARGYTGECIGAIGQQYPETRLECIQALVSTLNALSSDKKPPYTLNRLIINTLVDLKAVEALTDVERAFKEVRVDTSMLNNWDIFQARMGLK